MDGGRRLAITAFFAMMVVSGCSEAAGSSTPAETPPPAASTTAGEPAAIDESPAESPFTDLDEVADRLDQGGD